MLHVHETFVPVTVTDRKTLSTPSNWKPYTEVPRAVWSVVSLTGPHEACQDTLWLFVTKV